MGRRLVFVRPIRPQHVDVVQKLGVANLEHHVQSKVLTGLFEQPSRPRSSVGERWDDNLIRKTGKAVVVTRVPFGYTLPTAPGSL